MKDCCDLFACVDQKLGDDGYLGPIQQSNCRLFAIYFHNTPDKKKEDILADLLQSEGHFRIVIATNALGMGVNIPQLNTISHYGPPRAIESYMQEIGRAGRTGCQAEATIYFKPMHLIGCSEDIKGFVTGVNTCRRQVLEAYFSEKCDLNRIIPAHLCCDVCETDCA